MTECVAGAEDGARVGVEADAGEVRVAAEAIAGDPRLWHPRRRLEVVSWEAMRLQYGRGKTQREVAREFGVSERTISLRKNGRPPWRNDMGDDERKRLSCVVRLALQMRRASLGVDPPDDPAVDDAMCEWPRFRDVTTPRFVATPAPAERTAPDDVETDARFDATPWRDIAHAAQMPPEGAWRTWMLMGGRGAGKTRAGAEWVRGLVESGMAKRIALVGPTLHDVREVMIDGPSGLRAIAPEAARPTYEATRRRLVWPGKGPCAGAVAFAFSAEDPDSLRGPQFDAAWCDEIGAWAKDVETWNTLAFGMRLGAAPRIVVTTTPRPRALVRLLVERAEKTVGGVQMTRAGTRANAANLAPDFVAGLEEDYAGTELGRQEIDGELIEDLPDALWSRAMIETTRATADEAEGLSRVVVAVDPPATATGRSDACGIIVAGVKKGVVYVLADATVRGLKPADWAERVMLAAESWGARTIVAEANQGGEMVRAVLDGAGASERGLRVRLARASKSKRERAQPVSVLYTKLRVRHVRVLKELEDEMCAFGAAEVEGRRPRSPDRVDALVWAVDELTRKVRRPRVEGV